MPLSPRLETPAPVPLAPGVQVLQRGWLSSNNTLIRDGKGAATLVDSGYCSHSAQTLALVASALNGDQLTQLVNTHLHSDHCGGNAALQASYPGICTLIPPGHAQAVTRWSVHELTFEATGQSCPRFAYQGLLIPGQELRIGTQRWQIHAAPGHDPHSVVLFEPVERILISADALWENGFGVVFPELDGIDAFGCVSDTLDLIESLGATTVIPGHGSVFHDVAKALATARARLNYFVRNPERHRNYAAKVLLKFKLLELQETTAAALGHWAGSTPYLRSILGQQQSQSEVDERVCELMEQLVQSGAARRQGMSIYNQD